jgi:plasmid stability protein
MSSILIRNVPEEIKNTLQRKAKLNGLSLQEFLIEELTRLANNYETIKSSIKIDRSDLPKIKASAIVDAIKSGRSLNS